MEIMKNQSKSIFCIRFWSFFIKKGYHWNWLFCFFGQKIEDHTIFEKSFFFYLIKSFWLKASLLIRSISGNRSFGLITQSVADLPSLVNSPIFHLCNQSDIDAQHLPMWTAEENKIYSNLWAASCILHAFDMLCKWPFHTQKWQLLRWC